MLSDPFLTISYVTFLPQSVSRGFACFLPIIFAFNALFHHSNDDSLQSISFQCLTVVSIKSSSTVADVHTFNVVLGFVEVPSSTANLNQL